MKLLGILISLFTVSAQAAGPDLITIEQTQMMKEFIGLHKIISCEFKKTVDGMEDTKSRPCDAETLQLQYQTPVDYYLNFYLFKGGHPQSGGTLIYGRRAWVKHTGCMEMNDSVLCYDIKPGAWNEKLTTRKNSCIANEQDSTDLVWEIHSNGDGTYTLSFDEKIVGFYCDDKGALTRHMIVTNVMKVVFAK